MENPRGNETRMWHFGSVDRRRKLWKMLFNVQTFYAHTLPIVIEILFLQTNLKHLFADRAWFLLPTQLNPVKFPLVVLLPSGTLPTKTQNPSTNSTYWEVTFDPETMNCNGFRSDSTGTETWFLQNPNNRSPELATKTLLAIFLVCRWILLLVRAVLLITKVLPPADWGELGIFLFVYVCSCIFSICVLGTQIRDCIDWWAFGGDSLQLFSWQHAYWILNGAGLAILLFAFILFNLKGCPFMQGCLQRWSRRSADVCSDPLHFIALVFFTGSAFLGSALVLTLGIYKFWILSVWFGIVLLVLDHFVRHQQNRNNATRSRRALMAGDGPRGDSGSSRGRASVVTKLPILQEDGKFQVFKLVPNTCLFAPIRKESEGDETKFKIVSNSFDDTSRTSDRDGVTVYSSVTSFPVDHENYLETFIVPSCHSAPVSTFLAVNPNEMEIGTGTSQEALKLAEEGGGFGACLVCLEEHSSIILQPCGHGALCRLCIKKMIDREQKRADLHHNRVVHPSVNCPLCRCEVVEVFEVFGKPRLINQDSKRNSTVSDGEEATHGSGEANYVLFETQRIWRFDPIQETHDSSFLSTPRVAASAQNSPVGENGDVSEPTGSNVNNNGEESSEITASVENLSTRHSQSSREVEAVGTVSASGFVDIDISQTADGIEFSSGSRTPARRFGGISGFFRTRGERLERNATVREPEITHATRDVPTTVTPATLLEV